MVGTPTPSPHYNKGDLENWKKKNFKMQDLENFSLKKGELRVFFIFS